MHPHEVAVHFDGIASSREVKGPLVFVEFHKHFALHIMDISSLDHLRGSGGCARNIHRIESQELDLFRDSAH